MYDVTLKDIDREQSKVKFWPGFSAEVESLYRTETVSDQHKSVAVSFIVGLSLINLFTVSDYFLTQSDFFLYAFGRLGVITPVGLLLIFFLYRNKTYYDFLVCSIPCWVTAIFSILLIMSQGSYRSNYLFGEILLIICGCVIGRPLLRSAVVSVTFQVVCYHVVLLVSDVVAPGEKMFSSLFCISGGIIALLTLYILEQTGRRAFLSNFRARLLNRQLEKLTLTDQLTGIDNRRAFDETTRQFWVKAPDGAVASVILIDIDHFKLFNDHYGHPAGDSCLKTVAACISGAIDRTVASTNRGRASRFGGEEFIVFLPDTDFTTARHIAETIRMAICDANIPHPVIATHPFVSASLGVASSLVRDCGATDLVTHADMALYAAKRNGRNQVWPPLALADRGLNRTAETMMISA